MTIKQSVILSEFDNVLLDKEGLKLIESHQEAELILFKDNLESIQFRSGQILPE